MIKLDHDRCVSIARQCSKLKVRRDFYARPFLNFDADRETKLRVYLMSAAICHQTHHLHHAGMDLWGWDYIEFGFLKMLRERNVLLNPGYISICREIDIEGMLLAAFSPDGDPANCTLDRIPERTAMLIEICRELKINYGSKVSGLIDASEGRLVNGEDGLYESLSRFKAFSDPFRKKISFFIKLATDAGVLRIRDPENLVPVMDYHMQRVLLRMGCLQLQDAQLRDALLSRKIMESDQEVRLACIEAMKVISLESGHDLLKMNDIFWPLGRSCCNESKLCADGSCAKVPCTFSQVADIADHQHCFFEEVCRGKDEAEYRDLWEPTVSTHYY